MGAKRWQREWNIQTQPSWPEINPLCKEGSHSVRWVYSDAGDIGAFRGGKSRGSLPPRNQHQNPPPIRRRKRPRPSKHIHQLRSLKHHKRDIHIQRNGPLRNIPHRRRYLQVWHSSCRRQRLFAAKILVRDYRRADNHAILSDAIERIFRVQHDLIFMQKVPIAEILTTGIGNNVGSALFLLPFSRGSVHITSFDPGVYPAINPNYFMVDWDLKLQRRIAQITAEFWANGSC
ncbi:uncharacterized protein BDV17DRAFT_4566 [Aspergillus undulatus]|uniref:uncharacterized protein n=1 Tax=Aspergillus undulatus TaxID=1810928 RepID=UPI003CCDBBAF